MEKCQHEIIRTGGVGYMCTYYMCIVVKYMYIHKIYVYLLVYIFLENKKQLKCPSV